MTTEEIEMEQYRALRGEILRAMEDGNQVMSFGLAAIGIVISAGLSVKDTALGFIMFAAVVPLLSALVLSIWFASYERLGRASYFITGIEQRLKQAVQNEFPTWDSWLRTPSRNSSSQHHFWSTENSGVSLFACLFLASLAMSLFAGGEIIDLIWRVCAAGVGLLTFLGFSFLMKSRMKRSKDWLRGIFGDLEQV
jgi:cell division protein FtsW (lipid II flippase)